MSFWKNFITLVTLAGIAVGMLTVSSNAQDATHLSLIEDASGLFNERGFLKSNSFSLDGNEVINDYNGNLMFSQGLRYMPITQNGIHEELRIAYNGSVGHIVRSGFMNVPPRTQLNVNLPEWIISINNIAIQTFNFENEAISWATLGNSNKTSLDDDVAALINGYHSSYTHISTPPHGVVSILMGDGSIKQLTSMPGDSMNGRFLYSGEYRSLSKDDRSKGYLEWDSGDFTLFQEDGMRVKFQLYKPRWRTVDSVDFNNSTHNQPKIYLPITFKSQMGTTVGVNYDSTITCGGVAQQIYGRPLVKDAAGYKFDWGGLKSGWPVVDLKLDATLNGQPDYTILIGASNGGVASICDERNRGQVVRITDAVGRETNFEYRQYIRYGEGLGPFFFSDTSVQRWSGKDFEAIPRRISKITYPDGGVVQYSYYKDPLTAWPTPGVVQDSLLVDFGLLCDDPFSVQYPCKKSDAFDLLGRDPYFTNMVVAKTKTTNNTIISRDSLTFSWVDNLPTASISVNDAFFTSRMEVVWDSVDASEYPFVDSAWITKRKANLEYRQFPEQGFYAKSMRDRGWNMKLMSQTEYDGHGIEVSRRQQFWDIDDTTSCYPFCNGTFALRKVINRLDGIPTEQSFEYEYWHGNVDPTADTVNNLIKKTTIDAINRRLETYFDSTYFFVNDTDSYYNNTLVEKTKFLKPDLTLLGQSATEYYDGSSDSGFVGQTKRTITYEVDTGAVVDSIVEKLEYVPSSALRILDQGALRKRISPKGDSTIFHYQEFAKIPPGYAGKPGLDSMISPVLALQVLRDGTIDSVSRRFDGNGPYWWKLEQFKSGNSIIVSDTVITGILDPLTVVARANLQGNVTKIDTIQVDQSISYSLELPAWLGGQNGCFESLARIKKNGVTIHQIGCQPSQQTIYGTIGVLLDDIIQVDVEHGGPDPGNYAAIFTHDVLDQVGDTTIVSDTIPDAIVSYQHVDNEGKPIEIVGPHLFMNEIHYDKRDRVKRVLLQGEFITDPTAWTTDSLLPSPFMDGTGAAATNNFWDCDSLFVFDTGATFQRSAMLSYENLNLNNISVITSAYLTLHKVRGEGLVRLHTYGGATYPTCAMGVANSHDSSSYIWFASSQDSIKLNVTSEVQWWQESGSLKMFGVEPNGFGESNIVLYSSTATDPNMRPKLEIFYRSSLLPDTIYSIRYDYDDNPYDTLPLGKPGVTVTSLIKSGADTYPLTSKLWFDGFGRSIKTELIDSLGNIDSTRTKYDFADRPVSGFDQLDYETKSEYDARDRNTRTTYPDSASSNAQVSYSKSSFQAIGLDTTVFADTNLYLTTFTDENGNQTKTFDDILGQLRLRLQFLGNDTINTYFEYDDYGNQTLVIRPNGDSVIYEYNSLGQLVREIGVDYDQILYQYDKNSNLIARKNGNIAVLDDTLLGYSHWQYTKYDALGRPIEAGLRTDWSTDSTTYIPATRSFFDQSFSSYSIGKLSLSLSNENGYKYGEKYDYDYRDRLIRQANYFNVVLDSVLLAGTTDRYEYKLSGDSFIYLNEYNMADQLTKLTYPDGMIVTYAYDQLGRLKSVGDATNAVKYATLIYTIRGELEQMLFGDTIQMLDYAYNARGWVNTINAGSSDNLKRKFAERLYYYDNPHDATWPAQKNGNIMFQKLSVEGVAIPDRYSYKYDDLDRLIEVDKDSTLDYLERFNYDNNGNRLSYRQGLPIDPDTSIYHSTKINCLIRRESNSVVLNQYTYDPSGNLATDSSKATTFDYDIFNRLDTVTFADPAFTKKYLAFGYSASGDRVYKRYHTWWQDSCGGTIILLSQGGGGSLLSGEPSPIGGGETQAASGPGGGLCPDSGTAATYYVRGNGGKVLAEYNSLTNPNPVNKFIYAGDQRIAIENISGQTFFYLNDHLGSARLVVDTAGMVKDKIEYYAFGASLSETVSTGQDYKYTGKPFDNDGGLNLYYYGARYYDAETGRFCAIDPRQGDSPEWSPYVYTNDNPLKYVDPDGEFIILALAVVAGVLLTHDFANAPSNQGEADFAAENFVKTDAQKVVETAAAVSVVFGIAKAVDNLLTPDNGSPSPAESGSSPDNAGSGQGNNARSKTKGLEKQLKSHEQKLKDYKKNPDKHDNKGKLKKAGSNNNLRKKIIKGREKKLKKEIKTYKNNIKKEKKKDGA